MVKSTVEWDPGIQYPMLMESTTNPGLVIIATSDHHGTVVAGGDVYGHGFFSKTWSPDVFRPFHGRVILEGSE